jgi:anti-sigma-K factor RskA
MTDLHDLAALYVLDALTPEETQNFEHHLADCDACQKEVADMRDVTMQLSRSVQAEPPPSLRASVLAGIALTTQDQTALSLPDSPSGTVVPLHRRLTSRLPYLVAAAAVLLAVGFGGWGLQSRDDAHQAQDRQAQIEQLLVTPDVRSFTAPVASGGTATVLLSQIRNRAVFVAGGLPTLPADKVYELWTISGDPVPAGTFSAGTKTSLVTLPHAALNAATVAVTVEPKGGSDHPTTKPIVALSLA